MRIEIANNLAQFSAVADDWDKMWDSSQASLPTLKSMPLISAVKHFYRPADFRTILVYENNQLVAGLPLVKSKLKNIFNIFSLPNNQWGEWGDLMVDQRFESPQIYQALFDGLNRISKLPLRLTQIETSSEAWTKFLGACKINRRVIVEWPAWFVGMIDHEVHWPDFESQLSKDFRKKLSKYHRRFAKNGDLTFEHHYQFNEQDLDRYTTMAFELENTGWKGKQKSSVIASGQLDFFLENAQQLANQNSLRVSFLRLDGKPIAFNFGAIGKRTYYSWKIGYDPEFAKFAPGHVLQHFLIRTFHDMGCCDVQDKMGAISDATRQWSSRFKLKSNVLISSNSLKSKSLVRLYLLYRTLRNLRKSRTGPSQPAAGMKPRTTGSPGQPATIHR